MVRAEDESEGVDEEEPWVVRHKVYGSLPVGQPRRLRTRSQRVLTADLDGESQKCPAGA